MRHLLLSVALTVFAAACSSADDTPADQNQGAQNPGAQPAGSQSPAVTPAAGQAAPVSAVYDVKCGCSIDGIDRCGNYVMIDGKYVPLMHPSLGKMEFCAQKDEGAKIEASGAMADGKFVATTWQLVE